MLLSTQGLLLSFGSAAAEGQLGLGDPDPRVTPELILCLKEAGAKIQGVSCGFKHTVARSSLGKVFTWGWGGMGQLGHGGTECELSPRQLAGECESLMKKKVIQVSAGYSHTVVMTEGRKLFWCGTCGSLLGQKVPVRVRLEQRFPELFGNKRLLPPGTAVTAAGAALANSLSFFTPVKVNVAWSRTMAASYITVLDLRSLASNIGTSSATPSSVSPSAATIVSITAQVNSLATRWNAWEIDPPYVEGLAGLFSAGAMLRGRPGTQKKPPGHRSGPGKAVGAAGLQRAILRSELKFDIAPTDKALLNKTKEVEKTFKSALERDPETLSQKERQLVSFVLRNAFG